MWAIVEVVTFCLNLVVITSMMNQSRRQWLLFDVLATTINLNMAMEIELDPFVDGNETFDQFHVELPLLSKNMRQEVVKVICPFFRVFEIL